MNKIITIIIVVIIAGGVAFYGGTKYTKSQSSQEGFSRADFQNLSSEERQQRFQELGNGANRTFGADHEGGDSFRRGGFRSGANDSRSLTGEVLSQSEDSLTIKLNDGSTKIIFVSDSTQITKFVEGTIGNLNEGDQISVSGEENPDGSYSAQTIQSGAFSHN